MPTWLFQGNPDQFDIDGYLANREVGCWEVRQKHLAERMAPGDLVYLWSAMGKSGERDASGVVASAVILAPPSVFPEDPADLKFWKTDGGGPALRVRLRFDKVASKREVLKRDWLAEDPVLADLGVLKLRNATNYPVELHHAERLAKLWANTGRDWNRAESVAGMWAYDQTYGSSISKLPGSVVANVALLIGRAVTGVYAKVLNFRFIDPRVQGGLSGGGESDRLAWREFFDETAVEIRSSELDDEFRKLWYASAVPMPEGESPPPPLPEFGEAPNDDRSKLQTFVRAVRRGQPAFRRNLLAAYEGKCCITGWAPEAVLEAAHIEEHAKSGLNSMANGLLLRADLHALFDEGLLHIHPDSLLVEVSPGLDGTPYRELQGQKLRAPVRGAGPSRELLRGRWTRRGNS